MADEFDRLWRCEEKNLTAPLRWRKPCRVRTSDLFHEKAPDEWIDRIFAVMALSPQHTFQILTKRPERMRAYMTAPHPAENLCFDWKARVSTAIDDLVPVRTPHSITAKMRVAQPQAPLPNVWLGVSVEDQATADERIPLLLQTPAAIRFVSYEPALGPVDFGLIGPEAIHSLRGVVIKRVGQHNAAGNWHEGEYAFPSERLSWVICGGESGPHARPMHPDWARSVRDQCAAANVPFFFKQWGEWLPGQNEGHPTFERRKIAHWQDGGWGPRDASRPSKNYIMWDSEGRPHAGGTLTGGNYFEVAAWSQRIGKKRAGRLLDGVEHNGFPAQSEARRAAA